MHRLQQLFNTLAGIHHNEAALRERARAIFAPAVYALPHLETPAYLRRRARLVAAR